MTARLRALRFASTATLGLSAFAVIFISQGSVEQGSSSAAKPGELGLSGSGPVRLTQRVFLDFEDLRKENIRDYATCPRWYDLLGQYKSCIAAHTQPAQIPPERVWSTIHDWTESCGGRLLRHVLGARYLSNRDDVKLILPPHKPTAELSAVTVGIGNDTAVEQRLQGLLPQTKFFGADPIAEDGAPFKALGQYHQVAINDRAGYFNASVLRGRKYEWDRVDAVTLESFLSDKLSLPLVDILFMDVEGAEYRILPQLSQPWTKALPICQLNMELHGPLANYSLSYGRFNRLIADLVTKSDFVPLWVPPPLHHHRFFLLNWKAPVCIAKFFSKWC